MSLWEDYDMAPYECQHGNIADRCPVCRYIEDRLVVRLVEWQFIKDALSSRATKQARPASRRKHG